MISLPLSWVGRARRKVAVAVPLLVVPLLAIAPVRAIINGQVDTFEDGADGWVNGFGDLEVRTTGGPAGAGDHFIVIVGGGFPGALGRTCGFNNLTWTGNYKTANVNAIEMDLKCLSLSGQPNVKIRLGFRVQTGLLTTNGVAGYVTSTAAQLTADGLWHHFVFDFTSLIPVNATVEQGGGPPPPLSTLLQGPAEIRIFNSSVGGVLSGDLGVAITLGIDNIRAIPGLNVTSFSRLANQTMQLNFKGAPNVLYTIQATADLTQPFTNIGSATAAANGTFQFTDNNAPTFTKRFYRAVVTNPGGRPAGDSDTAAASMKAAAPERKAR